MRQILLAVVVLFGMVACSDDGDGDPAKAAPSDRDVPSSELERPVTAGSYAAPTGPVPTDLAAIRAEIEAAVDEPDLLNIGEGNGPGAGRMYVSLPLGREHIADQLLARYGDVLRVDVGGLPWPLDDEAMFAGCADPLPAGDPIEGLSAVLSPGSTEVALGEAVTGSVVLTNATAEPVAFTWGGAGVRGHLVRPGTDEPVGMFIGAETMQLVTTPAPAEGTSEPVALVVGVVSCRPQVHTAVQPGRYDLVTVLHLEDGRSVRSAPVEIIVAAP
jgi:hypothetical protein